LLGLEDAFQRQVHQVGAELIHLPLENGEVGLDSNRVGKGGGQSAKEGAQALNLRLLWHRVPGVVESRLHIVLVQGDVQHRVLIVHLEQVAVTLLDLVNGLFGPKLREMVAVRVEHLLNEVAMAQLDDLVRHHRRGILLERFIIFVTFSADVAEPSDDKHGVLGELAHDLLLGWRVQAFVARLGEQALVLDVKDELGPLDAPLLECLEFVAVVGGTATVDNAKLRNQSADEHLDEQFLLCDQQRAVLRHDERLVDLLDGRCNGVSDDPPLIRRQLVAGIGRHVMNDGATVLLEEVEQHAQNDPTVGLLGALHVHAHDQVCLRA